MAYQTRYIPAMLKESDMSRETALNINVMTGVNNQTTMKV